jgi:hypothetical protein
VADGRFSEAGLNEYLVLLSLYLTCQYKEVGFLFSHWRWLLA